MIRAPARKLPDVTSAQQVETDPHREVDGVFGEQVVAARLASLGCWRTVRRSLGRIAVTAHARRPGASALMAT